ncbi:MAG: hypothetical protein IJP75_03535 [Bacteroidaceae bacterium]|nr:hypothetical protein [Bacteroidaceae bacterium]
MMFTKKLFWVALTVMCTLGLNMSGQNANETLRQKYERLAKEADANPTDWQKQFEAAHMLLDKNSELYDQAGAGKYYERIYHLVADVNQTVPDSVCQEAFISLMFVALDQQNPERAMFYGDEMNRYVRVTNDEESTAPMLVNTMAVVLEMTMERNLEAADRLNELRKDLVRRNFQGTENTDVVMAMLYEQVMEDYKQFAENKLLEVIIDGKPYVLIAKGMWNVEYPFMGWMADVPDEKLVFLGEDGQVYDDLHGQILSNFNWSDKERAVVKSEETNTRLITVTPERRQQLVEIYKNYLNK